jgi:GT2 family glycosyltransferase
MDKHATGFSISVIIVSYNVRFFLEQALRSVFKAVSHLSVQVWVVDNASSDDSVDMVKQKFPMVQIIENKDNVGFARANNMAIRQSKAAYILLLNPDTLLEEGSLLKCFQFMENNKDAGALGVRMIDGTGNFLPESKRGIPTPWVAFCKTFGLSSLFPGSPLFNTYYLGHLSANKIAAVPVLSGAFMFLRAEALHKSGLLDEDFFMYGEDIDLSVRLLGAGYKNYFFPETTIIHYKGESTRKGSINYVRIFYQAMILFAEKHLAGKYKGLYVFLLHSAIYIRAVISLLGQWLKKFGLPLSDTLLAYAGLFFLQFLWGFYRFDDAHYYNNHFFYFNAPFYVFIWLIMLFIGGAYDKKVSPGSVLSSLLMGSLIISAVYGFFEPAYRNSRALILLGTLWNALSMVGMRYLVFPQFRRKVLQKSTSRCLIVGSLDEGSRAQALLDAVGFDAISVGLVSPQPLTSDTGPFLGQLIDLDDICRINRVDDIIFCSKDVSSTQMMYWMNKMAHRYQFRILQASNESMISSYSKNDPGEWFTYRIHLHLADQRFKRQKRLFDLMLCLLYIFFLPVFILTNIKNVNTAFQNLLSVLTGKRTWFGYDQSVPLTIAELPEIPNGVYPISSILFHGNEPSIEKSKRANLNYARHYDFNTDLNLLGQLIIRRCKIKPGNH